MTITVTHTTPADDSFSAAGALAWDANHSLVGVGTMAEQNANNVAITGGTMSGVAITGYVPTTRTISVSTGLTGGGDLSADRTIAFADANVGAWAGTPSSANLLAAMTTKTGTGLLVFGTNPTLSSPNIDVIDFDTSYSTALTAGQLGWDGNNTLGIGMFGGNVVQRIGEDGYIYVKASSSLTKGQLAMFTGAVGASSVVTAAPATGVTVGQYIIGIAAESISANNFGLIQVIGSLKGFDTSAFSLGAVLYYDSANTGGLTATYPTSGPIVTVATVTNAGSSGSGSVQIRVSVTQRVTASTGISVAQTSSGVVITNTSPSSGGTVTSVGGTGTVSGITLTGTVTSSGNLTLGGTLDLSSPPAIGGTSANTGKFTSLVATSGIGGGAF